MCLAVNCFNCIEWFPESVHGPPRTWSSNFLADSTPQTYQKCRKAQGTTYTKSSWDFNRSKEVDSLRTNPPSTRQHCLQMTDCSSHSMRRRTGQQGIFQHIPQHCLLCTMFNMVHSALLIRLSLDSSTTTKNV